jgi:hypothetical protein
MFKLTTPRILLAAPRWQTFLGAGADQTKLFRGQRPFGFTLKTFINLPFLSVFIGCQPDVKIVVEKYY